jgi:hypothetical protein
MDLLKDPLKKHIPFIFPIVSKNGGFETPGRACTCTKEVESQSANDLWLPPA